MGTLKLTIDSQNNMDGSLMWPAQGTAKPNNPCYDPDNQFTVENGLDLSTGDYCPKKVIRQLVVRGGASGQGLVTPVRVYFLCQNGAVDYEDMQIAAYGSYEIDRLILAVFGATSTALNGGLVSTATLVRPYF